MKMQFISFVAVMASALSSSAYRVPTSHRIDRSPTLANLPEAWDWRAVHGRNWLTPSWNQHVPAACGSCYIHSALSAISDRMHIASGGNCALRQLSRQTFLNCGASKGYGHGCDGGDVYDVYGYMKEHGLPDDSCQAYTAADGKCDAMGMCMNCMEGDGASRCWPVRHYVNYKIQGYNKISVHESEREAAVMSELMTRGPVACGMFTDDRFDYEYAGGVWNLENSNGTNNHDVELVGWGESQGVPYWTVRNSWGTFWGEEGFFRIKRGLKKGLVDGDCWFAVPEKNESARDSEIGSMFGIVQKSPRTSTFVHDILPSRTGLYSTVEVALLASTAALCGGIVATCVQQKRRRWEYGTIA